MKLDKVYEDIIHRLEPYEDKLQDEVLSVKSSEYNNFEVRLAWHILKLVVTAWEMCQWYDLYECNDTHITTLGKKVCKHFKLI